MIIGNDFIFVHIPKTAGCFVAQVLNAFDTYKDRQISFGDVLPTNNDYQIPLPTSLEYNHILNEEGIKWLASKEDNPNFFRKHVGLQHIKPELLKGKHIFAFVRFPLYWMASFYSESSFYLQERDLPRVDVNGFITVNGNDVLGDGWSIKSYFDGFSKHYSEVQSVTLLKYENLYFNVLYILDKIGVRFTKRQIQTILDEEKVREAKKNYRFLFLSEATDTTIKHIYEKTMPGIVTEMYHGKLKKQSYYVL